MTTVDIRRSPEEVFKYLAHFENVPMWNYAIAETAKVSAGPVGVGTRYRQVRSIPRRSEEGFEVTAFEPHRKLAIEGTLGPFASVLEYRIDPTEGGSRVTNEVQLTPRGVLGVVGQLAPSRVKEAVAKNLGELKRLLDAAAHD
ncbi:MAG: SRPBCC family protein [Actinomycetota bacterium]